MTHDPSGPAQAVRAYLEGVELDVRCGRAAILKALWRDLAEYEEKARETRTAIKVLQRTEINR